jgi:hypothetical protein
MRQLSGRSTQSNTYDFNKTNLSYNLSINFVEIITNLKLMLDLKYLLNSYYLNSN